MAQITPGYLFFPGEQVSPQKLNDTVDLATLGGIPQSAFGTTTKFFSYGSTRPTLTLGAIHYDTTAGLEGLVYAFVSPSNASVSSWLYAMPRRECMCWTNSACSFGTPLFLGLPNHIAAGPEFKIYDGLSMPMVWMYSGASGADPALVVALESKTAAGPIKCCWSGILPDLMVLGGAGSGASAGSPLFVDYASGGGFKCGAPTPRSIVVGVNTLNGPTAAGAILWGNGPALLDEVI